MVVTYFIKKVSACFIASPVNNIAKKTRLDAVAMVEDTVFTRVQVDPMYKSTPHFGAKIEVFSYFWVRIFFKNLSYILEFSLRL